MDEIVSYKGRFCEKHSDFIWGDYIDDEVIEGLYFFWHNQNFLEFREGQVYTGGDTYVDKEYKDPSLFACICPLKTSKAQASSEYFISSTETHH